MKRGRCATVFLLCAFFALAHVGVVYAQGPGMEAGDTTAPDAADAQCPNAQTGVSVYRLDLKWDSEVDVSKTPQPEMRMNYYGKKCTDTESGQGVVASGICTANHTCRCTSSNCPSQLPQDVKQAMQEKNYSVSPTGAGASTAGTNPENGLPAQTTESVRARLGENTTGLRSGDIFPGNSVLSQAFESSIAAEQSSFFPPGFLPQSFSPIDSANFPQSGITYDAAPTYSAPSNFGAPSSIAPAPAPAPASSLAPVAAAPAPVSPTGVTGFGQASLPPNALGSLASQLGQNPFGAIAPGPSAGEIPGIPNPLDSSGQIADITKAFETTGVEPFTPPAGTDWAAEAKPLEPSGFNSISPLQQLAAYGFSPSSAESLTAIQEGRTPSPTIGDIVSSPSPITFAEGPTNQVPLAADFNGGWTGTGSTNTPFGPVAYGDVGWVTGNQTNIGSAFDPYGQYPSGFWPTSAQVASQEAGLGGNITQGTGGPVEGATAFNGGDNSTPPTASVTGLASNNGDIMTDTGFPGSSAIRPSSPPTVSETSNDALARAQAGGVTTQSKQIVPPAGANAGAEQPIDWNAISAGWEGNAAASAQQNAALANQGGPIAYGPDSPIAQTGVEGLVQSGILPGTENLSPADQARVAGALRDSLLQNSAVRETLLPGSTVRNNDIVTPNNGTVNPDALKDAGFQNTLNNTINSRYGTLAQSLSESQGGVQGWVTSLGEAPGPVPAPTTNTAVPDIVASEQQGTRQSVPLPQPNPNAGGVFSYGPPDASAFNNNPDNLYPGATAEDWAKVAIDENTAAPFGPLSAEEVARLNESNPYPPVSSPPGAGERALQGLGGRDFGAQEQIGKLASQGLGGDTSGAQGASEAILAQNARAGYEAAPPGETPSLAGESQGLVQSNPPQQSVADLYPGESKNSWTDVAALENATKAAEAGSYTNNQLANLQLPQQLSNQDVVDSFKSPTAPASTEAGDWTKVPAGIYQSLTQSLSDRLLTADSATTKFVQSGPDLEQPNSTVPVTSGELPSAQSEVAAEIPTPDTSVPSGQEVTQQIQSAVNAENAQTAKLAEEGTGGAAPSALSNMWSSVKDSVGGYFSNVAGNVQQGLSNIGQLITGQPSDLAANTEGQPAYNPIAQSEGQLALQGTGGAGPEAQSASQIPTPDTSIPTGEQVTQQVQQAAGQSNIPLPQSSPLSQANNEAAAFNPTAYDLYPGASLQDWTNAGAQDNIYSNNNENPLAVAEQNSPPASQPSPSSEANNEALSYGGAPQVPAATPLPQNAFLTAYGVCMLPSGCNTMEGAPTTYSLHPTPSGNLTNEIYTLDGYANGQYPYVTVAGPKDEQGDTGVIPSITYNDPATGKPVTLQDVPFTVADTGGAFPNGSNKLDVPISIPESAYPSVTGNDKALNSILNTQPFSGQTAALTSTAQPAPAPIIDVSANDFSYPQSPTAADPYPGATLQNWAEVAQAENAAQQAVVNDYVNSQFANLQLPQQFSNQDIASSFTSPLTAESLYPGATDQGWAQVAQQEKAAQQAVVNDYVNNQLANLPQPESLPTGEQLTQQQALNDYAAGLEGNWAASAAQNQTLADNAAATPLTADILDTGQGYALCAGTCSNRFTADQLAQLQGKTIQGVTASNFGEGQRTAYGGVNDPYQYTVASKEFPNNARLLEYNPITQEAAVSRVNDVGPFVAGRGLDNSTITNIALGIKGLGNVDMAYMGQSGPTGPLPGTYANAGEAIAAYQSMFPAQASTQTPLGESNTSFSAIPSGFEGGLPGGTRDVVGSLSAQGENPFQQVAVDQSPPSFAPTPTETLNKLADKLQSSQPVTAGDIQSFVSAARNIPLNQEQQSQLNEAVAMIKSKGAADLALTINAYPEMALALQNTVNKALGRTR